MLKSLLLSSKLAAIYERAKVIQWTDPGRAQARFGGFQKDSQTSPVADYMADYMADYHVEFLTLNTRTFCSGDI